MEKKQHSNTPTLQHSNASITVGIITISDRASAGKYDDLGGPALKKFAQKALWQVLAEAVVPDDHSWVQDRLPWVHLDDGLPTFTAEPDQLPQQSGPEDTRC